MDGRTRMLRFTLTRQSYSMNNPREIKLLLFFTGFVSSSLQFIMLREIVCLCGGTEFITGLFLSVWLILSSFGSGKPRGGTFTDKKFLFLFFAVTPVISLSLFIISSRLMIHPGETPSLLKTAVMLILTLAPTAIISSRAFIFLSNAGKINNRTEPGNSFGVETAGSVVAGIMSAAIVVLFIRTFLYFFIVEILTLFIFSIILFKPGVFFRIMLLLVSVSGIITAIKTEPDIIIRELQFGNIRIHETFDTPYGNVTTGKYYGEDVTFYDFNPVYYNNDNIRCEEDIHFGLLQSAKPDSILLISGGLTNHLPEIVKYKPEQIVYIEHDPGLIKTEFTGNGFPDSLHCCVLSIDAGRYLSKESKKFNVIIQLVPQPSTLSLNRFYSREYFATVKKNLSEGGVFVCNPLPAFNYVSDYYKKTLASIVNALKLSFRNVEVVPGNSLYIIASDDSLRTDFCRLSEEKKIKNLYVNCDYFNDKEISRRSSKLISELCSSIKPNTLLKPLASWYENSLLIEKQGNKMVALALLLTVIVISGLKVKRGTLLMYASSCTLSGLAVTIIFIFQALLGNAHLLSAFILSLLFSGLATGAAVKTKHRHNFIFYPVALSVILLLTGLLANTLLQHLITPVTTGILMLLTFIAGFFTGSFYGTMTSGRSAIATEKVYGADLSGSAAGYLLTGTILIPLLGLTMTTFILSGIILVSVFIVSVASKL
jgi:spermidine synthase